MDYRKIFNDTVKPEDFDKFRFSVMIYMTIYAK